MMRRISLACRGDARKRFLLKKEAKTLPGEARPVDQQLPEITKFFGSFFQKRTASLPDFSNAVRHNQTNRGVGTCPPFFARRSRPCLILSAPAAP
jgi:hypothetical protein